MNERYDGDPHILGWSQKFDTRYINTENAHKLPKRDLLFVKPYTEIKFPDVLSRSLFMVTNKVFDVIKLYEPTVYSKQVILLDGEHSKSETYHLPILKYLDCLHSDTVWKPGTKHFNRLVLDKAKLGNTAIFRPMGASHTIAIIRLDVAESILRRDAKGIGLVPVEIKE